MTKTEFINVMSNRRNITKKMAAEVVYCFVETLKDCVLEGEDVKIPNFASFELREIPEKTHTSYMTKNPKQVTVAAHKVVKVKLAPNFRNCLK